MSNNNPTEKLWCAMCGKMTDHQSGACPEITRLRASDAEAIQRRDAALKAARDAFESLRNNQNSRDCAGIVATVAIAAIDKELKP